ncbi:MAG: PD-(D/E)XK nuclease family protein, partial [Planctomycetes bacterium]|nr:PD-(D/E)XK nuclease family protein [Planctomycetota bacterium]
ATDGLRARLVADGFQVEHLPQSRRATGDLLRLERRVAGVETPSAPADGSVRFLAGADPEDEADRVARNVLRWTTEGIPRADILVVVRNLASDTATRIVDALRRHDVPARATGGEPLAAVPCVRSSLRAMRLVAGAAETSELVDALRHGDAVGVVDGDADRLDLAVRRSGAKDESAVLGLAAEVGAASVAAWIGALAKLRLPPDARPPSAVATLLFAAVPRLIRLRFAFPFADADESSVARDAAAMRGLRDLAADLVRGFRAAGVPSVAPRVFAERLATAAETSKFRPRDLRDDAVNVVDAEEARQWEARAVIVAGLRMGEFPVTAREDLFLTDADRATVEKQTGLRLPNRLDDALRREHLLFYSAVTRARERLVLTAPVSDATGNPVLRSPFLDVAMSILPVEARVLDGRERSPGDVRPAPGETLHRADLERTALAALTERFTAGQPTEIRPHTGYALLPHLVAGDDAVVRAAARWFAGREPSLREGGPGRRGMDHARLRSASSLADFAQCPYRHFARKGLRLDELPGEIDDGIDPLLAGSIAHKALEYVVLENVTTADAALACVDRAFGELAGHLRRDLRVESVRAQLRRVLPRLVATWTARGGLVPGFGPRIPPEWKFGVGGPEIAIGTGPDAVRLTGAVDRIEVDGAGNAIVIDYKWSAMSRFAGIERKIEAGIDVQLPIYVIAAQQALRLRVVAAGYITLREPSARKERWIPVVEGGAPTATKNPPPEGWGVGDGSEGTARAASMIVRLDQRIRNGECATTPRDLDRCGAGACPFADLCRFDGAHS